MFFLLGIVGIIMLVPAMIVHHKLQQPTSFGLWGIKAFSSASSLILLGFSLFLFLVGVIFSRWMLVVLGLLEALSFATHIFFVSSSGRLDDQGVRDGQNGVEVVRSIIRTFFQKNNSGTPTHMDVIFHTHSISGRDLLCDVWEPKPGDVRNGVGIIYLHGSAWTLFDKDYGTRPFFTHLVGQGYVVMDVAYRLYPETDMQGMVDDTRFAIAWLNQNAKRFQISRKKIVLCGGSAGGQIALLAAYSGENVSLKTVGLETIDLRVRGVISLYGPVDLVDTYYHTAQHVTRDSVKQRPEKARPQWLIDRMGDDYYRLGFDKSEEPGKLVPILGGTPEEVPEVYAKFSPINYVHENCPATCLILGTHDIITSMQSILSLADKLRSLHVPIKLQMVTEADHAFDLFLPKISAAAQNAYREVDRFLLEINSP